MKPIFVLLLTLVVMNSALHSQSCCGPLGATASFASFTHDKHFRNAHMEPAPFTLAAPRGAMIHFDCADGNTGQAYELKAQNPTNQWVFVIHEWWGLNDHVKHDAEQLQQDLGNVNVLALDLYDGKVASTRDSAAKYMSEANETRIRSIISGAIAHVGEEAHVCTIGWCFGGGWSLQGSLMLGKQAGGCVMYYGMPEADEKKLATLSVPVLFIFAKKDAWINANVLKSFEERMKRLHKKLSVHSYNADHAFANPSNPIYDKEATEDAHKHTVAFLREQIEASVKH